MSIQNQRLATALALFCLLGNLVPVQADSVVEPGPIKAFPWMHKGLRITYRQVDGFTPGTLYQLTPDADGHNFDAIRRQGTYNEGIWQQDIACIEGDGIVINDQGFIPVDKWPNVRPGTPPQLSQSRGFVGNTGKPTLQDYWLQPSQLDQYLQVPKQGDFETSRMPWKAGNETFDAVWIRLHQDKFVSICIYDYKTGLLLHRGITSQGNPPSLYWSGEPVPTGDVFNQMVDFIGMRDVNVPWADEQLPDWLLNTKMLHYRGGLTQRGMPGPETWVFSRLNEAIVDHGQGWLKFKVSSLLELNPNGPPQTAETAWAPSLTAGVWAGPTALAKLQRGQVLDEDPITKNAHGGHQC